MLTGGIILLYAFLAAFVCGVSLVILFQKIFSYRTEPVHTGITVISGLGMLGAWLQLFHLFTGINETAHFLFWLIHAPVIFIFSKEAIPYFKRIRKDFFDHTYSTVFLILLFIAALLNMTGRAGTGDIGDYHLQAVQWAEKFPAVPGLGNLIRQLANNSSWFLVQAFTGLSFLGPRSVYGGNALLLMVAGMYFLPRAQDKYFVLKAAALLYICLMSFRKYVGAVTNDYPVTLFTLIIFTELLSYKKESWKQKLPLFWLLLLIPTFKLSAIAMLIPALGFLWVTRKQEGASKLLVFAFCGGLFIYLPWFAVNIIQSGYLVYPVKALDLFSYEWKMPADVLQFELDINNANERAPGADIGSVLQMPFRVWFPQWLKHLDLFSFALLVLFCISSAAVAVKLFLKKERRNVFTNSPLIWIALTMACAFVLWLLNAPAPRFVFGYLVFGISATAWYFTKERASAFNRRRVKPFYLLCILVTGVNAFIFSKQYLGHEKMKDAFIKPPPYSSTEVPDTVLLKQGYVLIPEEGQQCWDLPLPCTGSVAPGLEWRGEEPSKGFRIAATKSYE